MRGRAGRRDLDESGIVMLMVDEKIDPSSVKEIVISLANPINSAFHWTYNMILNSLRIEEINPEYMLERSFFQFQKSPAILQCHDKIKSLQKSYDNIVIDKEEEVDTYYKIQEQLAHLNAEYHEHIVQPEHCVSFFKTGRLVKVQNGEQDFGWGVIIKYQKKHLSSDNEPDAPLIDVVDVLLQVSKDSAEAKVTASIKPPSKGERGIMQVVPVKLDSLQQFSSVRTHIPEDLRPLDNRMQILQTIQAFQERFPDGLPLLDPIKDMKIKSEIFKDIIKKIDACHLRLKHLLKDHPMIRQYLSQYKRKLQIESEIKEAKTELEMARSSLEMNKLNSRKEVLRKLEYCTAADVIESKGRVACEVISADALILTEMIFEDAFHDLDVYETTALLSCFVFQENSDEMPQLTKKLYRKLSQVQNTARRIAKISKKCKLDFDADAYVDSFSSHLMEVVCSWSKGASFSQIYKMTDVFEGSVILCMRRLEDLLRQMCQVAKAVGNTDLENIFSKGMKLIKRDIVAASFYI